MSDEKTLHREELLVEDRLVTVDGEIETRKRRKIRQGMVVKYDTYIINVM